MYQPSNGLMAMASESKQNLSVDNLSVVSLLSDVITEVDLKAGRYDNASCQVFWICPLHPEWGILPIKGGVFGEVQIKNASFEVEVRALMQLLQQPFGTFYNLECSALLGDGNCKVRLTATTWAPNQVYIAAAGGDAGIGSYVQPVTPNGYWYQCISALGSASSVTESTVGAGALVNSAAYLTPTKPGDAPASAPYGTEPFSVTTGRAQINFQIAPSGATEPTWPTTVGVIGKGAVGDDGSGGGALAMSGGTGDAGASYWGQGGEAPSQGVLPAGGSPTGGSTVTDNGLVWMCIYARSWSSSVTTLFTRAQFGDTAITWFPAEYFQYGILTWLTGQNAGLSMEVRSFDHDPRPIFYLLEAMPNPVAIGDTYTVTVGCAKTRFMCQSLFDNINNMRAFPDMPTEDKALITPDFTQQGTQAPQNQGGS